MATRTDAPAETRATPDPTRPLLPLWAALIAAAAAGVLLNAAFPEPAIWIAAFPAIALLLIALIGRRAWSSLLVGFVYGAVFYLILVSWTSRYLGPIPWLALGLLEGVLTALALIPVTLAYRWIPVLIRPGRLRTAVLSVVLAALWIGRELFLGNWPYGGFPWARIALTLSDTPAARVTSWIGISGLGFVMVLIVALLVELFRSGRRPRPLGAAVPVLLAVALALLPAFPTSPNGTLRIGAVQGNGPTGYFDRRAPMSVIAAQTAASEPLYGKGMDLLVWPEGGLDGDPFQDDLLANGLDDVADGVRAPILANAATQKGDEFFNTSFLWPAGSHGHLSRSDVQTHSKRHPVPFGEYVPDRAFYNAIAPELIGLIGRGYTPGDDAPVIRVGRIPVGLAICFDVIYDDLIAEGIDGGAQVLVFQTNNADFRGTAENLQQLAVARMRAVETGRAVVNISTVGTSQVIRPDGSTQASLHENRPGAMLEDVGLRTGATAGVILGPWIEQALLWGGLLVVAAAGVIARMRRRGSGA
ncbi:apolipoprotein N-acyltransferase [Microbacterium sp. ASV81]|uniref:Apolipoprotein N-acyltransferase n=1 Tax=Microbacterium capsulatum TaxID=3041921 RepID=A0ABU0XCL0_9MICO|nr:apolipoprotein N-acyltransferase [Microbacterium sp. ASV81]MDQ4212844.1 apolipoprotein N-acyltransferase [Microbacterium sp. ASV81]